VLRQPTEPGIHLPEDRLKNAVKYQVTLKEGAQGLPGGDPLTVLIENQLASGAEQKREAFYFPVTGISIKKHHDSVKMLAPETIEVFPPSERIYVGQNLMQHRVPDKTFQDFGPLPAKESATRIVDQLHAVEAAERLKHEVWLCRLKNKDLARNDPPRGGGLFLGAAILLPR
jgi:hypothetical protein